MLEEKDYSKQELADALYAGNIVNIASHGWQAGLHHRRATNCRVCRIY